MTLIERLRSLSACPEAIAWVQAGNYATIEDAWAACPRGDWLLWLASRCCGSTGSNAHRAVVLAACACARLTLPLFESQYPADPRPRAALDLTERWANRDPSVSLRNVRNAAYAYASASAAASASASASAAVSAASYSAYYAYYAAYYAASYAAASAECADIVRRMVPVPSFS